MNKAQVFDELLVMQCQGGSNKAFELLIKRWNKKLIYFAYKFTHDTDAAKDIVQESWLAVHKSLHRLHEPSKFKTWLYRLTYNKSMDYLRHASKTQEAENQVEQDELPEMEENSKWAVVQRALKTMAPEQKMILTLFYLEERSIKEIANILDLPEGTVKSRIFYARESLKKKYKEVNNETHR